MIFQSGKYCDITWVFPHPDRVCESPDYTVRIRDTGDTHLDIACKDLPHALELWTAIERSPEVKLVVNVSDYIVKEGKDHHTYDGKPDPELEPRFTPKKHCHKEGCWICAHNNYIMQADAYPPLDCMAANSNHDNGSEFADCRHRPIKDSKPGEFDLERME